MGSYCLEGHPKTRRPNGDWVCKPCVNEARNYRRKLQRSGCPHFEDGTFEGLAKMDGGLVCLPCLVVDANARRVANS